MSQRRHPLRLAAVLLSLSACHATSYHLVDPEDEMRYVVVESEVPAGWTERTFDDSQWAVMNGWIPLERRPGGVALVRRTFDMGPEAEAYEEMQLVVTGPSAFVAYLNGKQIAVASGTILVPPGLLRPSGNVLAIEARAAAGQTTLPLDVTLDGEPTAVALGPRVVRGPWVVQPTPKGITIVWETDVAVPSHAVVDGRTYDGGAGRLHRAVVQDLEPSRSYPYHVEVAGKKTEEAELMTAARPGERVRFVVYGDTRTNGDAHRRVVEAIRDEGPDFLFSTGDLVGTSNEEEWRAFFNIEYALLLNTPLYPALGNHDKMGGDARFKELFPVTGGNSFYSSDFGDVHVAALDSNSSLAGQAAWLDGDLQQARERGAKHLFIILHHGAYSGASGFGSHGSNAEARAHIVPIAAKHGVAAMFGGHDHIYERGQSPEGLAYFVTGGGGAPFHGAGRLPETLMSAVKHHYLVVDVAGPNVSITAKDLAGNAFDTVSLTR